ncbi:MAG: hypothetical protein QGF72_01200 [Candidatus Poseidoniaceae archaeon]|jgi:hypothetical protein|nr:hypothetical protein [Candidatus Poseidoniaceae archaeon]
MARKLGRGLDDLLDDNDVDLPFLSAYGEASGEHIEGSLLTTEPQELHAAMRRHMDDNIPEELKIKVVENGVLLEINAENALPLVPSDLAMPGFEKGELSDDRSSASVIITAWGVEVRRLLDRLSEHASL